MTTRHNNEPKTDGWRRALGFGRSASEAKRRGSIVRYQIRVLRRLCAICLLAVSLPNHAGSDVDQNGQPSDNQRDLLAELGLPVFPHRDDFESSDSDLKLSDWRAAAQEWAAAYGNDLPTDVSFDQLATALIGQRPTPQNTDLSKYDWDSMAFYHVEREWNLQYSFISEFFRRDTPEVFNALPPRGGAIGPLPPEQTLFKRDGATASRSEVRARQYRVEPDLTLETEGDYAPTVGDSGWQEIPTNGNGWPRNEEDLDPWNPKANSGYLMVFLKESTLLIACSGAIYKMPWRDICPADFPDIPLPGSCQESEMGQSASFAVHKRYVDIDVYFRAAKDSMQLTCRGSYELREREYKCSYSADRQRMSWEPLTRSKPYSVANRERTKTSSFLCPRI